MGKLRRSKALSASAGCSGVDGVVYRDVAVGLRDIVGWVRYWEWLAMDAWEWNEGMSGMCAVDVWGYAVIGYIARGSPRSRVCAANTLAYEGG